MDAHKVRYVAFPQSFPLACPQPFNLVHHTEQKCYQRLFQQRWNHRMRYHRTRENQMEIRDAAAEAKDNV